jgi:LacI family transcriptional regulator
VGILIDGLSGYGRAVMRGVMRYANLQRRWIIHEELRHIYTAPIPGWPQCDGAIIAGVGAPPLVDEVLSKAKHVVRCSGSADPARTPVVCMNDFAVGAMAAEHLLDCHIESFGFYGHNLHSAVSANRYRGFCETVAKRGFKCQDAGVGWTTSIDWEGDRHIDEVVEWLKALPQPVGIMAVDDSAAHDLAAICLHADIAVPERVAIIGVNNDDLMCESAWPPLSSVNCDYSRVGYIAASILDKLFARQKLLPEERHVQLAPLGIVRRQSTDILAVDNPDLADALRYIREHACNPCTVGDVLREVPVGRRWLERQFVKTLGRNPHDEIMRVRIETAKRLLLHRDLSLSEVGTRCGFAVQQNFGRAFLKATGSTPSAYRKLASRGATAGA